jgi:PTS system beta-glucosides-specific IIC component
MSDYTALAAEIIENVGGKDNVKQLTHCMTRLRFMLRDDSLADDEKLKSNPGVITVMKAKSLGQYQVVIGEQVPKVYREVMGQLGLPISEDDSSVASQSGDKVQKNLFQKIMDLITGIMFPVLNVMCAAGIIKGLGVVSLAMGLNQKSGMYLLINALGDAFFYFLPVIIAVSAAKYLKMDQSLGFALGAALVYPTINGVNLDVLGFHMNATYTSAFLPALFGMLVAAPLYHWLNKHVRESLKSFVVPFVTLIVTFPLTFMIVGPVANLVGNWLNVGINAIIGVSPLLAGIILSGLWQLMVLFGVHNVLVMVALVPLMAGNPSQFFALAGGATWAMAGMALAVFVRSKNMKTKQIAMPAFISTLFGITEPATYGLALPNLRMFVGASVSAAVGGAIAGWMGLKAYTYAGLGLIGLMGFINPHGATNYLGLILQVVVSFVVSFVVCSMLYSDKKQVAVKQPKKKNGSDNVKTKLAIDGLEMLAPVSGTVLPLSEAEDGAFSSGAMGKGLVILPDEGAVYAPFAGTVKALFPTKHAIGLVSDDGCEVLIHVGINTVELQGKYFTTPVKQGDRVAAGQLLIKFDKGAVEAAGYNTQTIVVVTNSDKYMDVVEPSDTRVVHGAPFLTVIS